jgi:prefoldin subunit 5
MNERIHLPLRPSGPSLGAYISALDLLAARLDTLASRARWPARVPINSKASFDGHLVHTDQVRVDIGAGWWVEMSATEAAAYVRRRKACELS